MRHQLRNAFFLLQTCCSLVWVSTLATEQQQQRQLFDVPLIQGAPIVSSQARAVRIAEFVSSHKIPDDVQRKDARLFENNEDDDEAESGKPATRTYVDLENFGSTGRLYDEESPLRRSLDQHTRHYATLSRQDAAAYDRDELLAGVRISSENPTTMLPILTTQRNTHAFDFVPVNIIREDAKGNTFVPLDNKNFEDLGDVSLVPAGSNTRIQVKKGPNGKDYEYEYVYYYYDEEDEGKAGGATASNSQEEHTRTSAPASSGPRRGGSNRSKYSTLERTQISTPTTTTTTVEPVLNEVIPNGNGNRARQLEATAVAGHEEVSEERLPTNTRFPPRGRSNNHGVETSATERASRVRGNRQRLALEAVDSSSFRAGGHQEGPEFPQNLPNGPVRFLGVTPNEGNLEKATALRGRGRPQRIQEPAPVQENYEEDVFTRKRPVAAQRDQSTDQHDNAKSLGDEQRDMYTDAVTDADAVTDSPTTQVSHAMDKVALDLYAFLQQGRSNLVDFINEAEEPIEVTDSSADSLTTETAITTFSGTEPEEAAVTTGAPTTVPTTLPTTSTTSTSTMMSTSSSNSSTNNSSNSSNTSSEASGRGKFKRPGPAISRNRFKSHGQVVVASSSTETSPTEASSPTQKPRGRFGGSVGKRARPALLKPQPYQHTQPAAEEPANKDSVEKPATGAGRGRYRGGSARSGPQPKTTQVTPTSSASDKPPRPGAFSKLGPITRRRGARPGVSTPAPASAEEGAAGEQMASSVSPAQETSLSEQPQRTMAKLPTAGARPKPLSKPIIKPGAGRLNLRPRPGQQATTTTTEAAAVDAAPAEGTIDEPASEGTEEETREAPAESSPPVRVSTANPLSKLRNRNRIQIQPKVTTARTPLPPAARRSHLLPRRKTTEAPIEYLEPATMSSRQSSEETDADTTEAQPAEVGSGSSGNSSNTVVSAKHEETRGLSSLLAPRRRIVPRIPGQTIATATK